LISFNTTWFSFFSFGLSACCFEHSSTILLAKTTPRKNSVKQRKNAYYVFGVKLLTGITLGPSIWGDGFLKYFFVAKSPSFLEQAAFIEDL